MSEVFDVPEVAAEVIAEHGPFLLTSTGVVTNGEPTYDEWHDAIVWAQKVEKSSPFWVGDLLAYGERWGEDSSQVLETTDYAYQTCMNAKSVCKAIPPERRRSTLPFSHHQEIASLPTVAEQEKWLDKAETENLTREQLRVQIKAAKSEGTGHPVELWVMVRCESIEDQNNLAEQLRLAGRTVRIQAKESQ